MQIKGKKKLVDKASAIIAVSKQTKNDLIDILKVPENKVTVIISWRATKRSDYR